VAFLSCLEFNVSNLSQIDILANLNFIYELSQTQFTQVLLILTSMLMSRRASKFASVELILSIIALVKYKDPFKEIPSNKDND